MRLDVDAGLIGIIWVIGIGSISTALSLILFDILRPRIPDVYNRRRRILPLHVLGFPVDDGRHKCPEAPSFKPFGWISQLLREPIDGLKYTHGLDTMLLLRFYRSMGNLIFRLSIIASIFLLPIYGTASNKSRPLNDPLRIFGIRILSLANVPDNDWRMNAVLVIDIVFCLLILATIVHETKFLVDERRKYRRSDHCSNYTIIAQDIPRELADQEKLCQVWETLFPDRIQKIMVVPNCSSLSKDRKEYWKAVRRRQRAEERTGNQFSTTISGLQVLEPPVRLPKPSLSEDAPNEPDLRGYPGLEQERSEIQQHEEHNNEEETEIRHCTRERRSIFRSPGLLQKQQTGKLKTGKIWPRVTGSEDAVTKWTKREDELVQSIHAGIMDQAGLTECKKTRAAIIIFKEKKDASLVGQSKFSAHPLQWSVSRAPDSFAINWDMFGIAGATVFPRMILAKGLLVGLIIFWVIPTALIQSLANIGSLSQLKPFEWLSFVNNLTPELSNFIQGLLPALTLEVVMILVPKVIRKIVSIQRLPSQVDVECQVLSNMIAFLYFSHLIYVVLSGSLLEYSNEIFENPSRVVEILATSVPQQGTFMMNVILLAAVFQNPLQIVQPTRLIKRWLCMRTARTSRDRELINSSDSLADDFEPYAHGTIFMVLAIVYSSLSPLLLLVCGLFFLTSYAPIKYNIVHTKTKAWEGFGALHHIALEGIAVGLVVKLLTMGGILSLHGRATLATCEFVLAGLVAAFFWIFKGEISETLKHGTIMDLHNTKTEAERDLVQQCDLYNYNRTMDAGNAIISYEHPSLSPLIPVREWHPL